jgi:methionyl-tRNA synthetase
MGKSLGNAIDPDVLVEKYGADATRYLLLSQFSFGNESNVRVERFTEKFNADLANGLGNLVARTSNLLEKNNIETDIKLGLDKKLIQQFNEKIENYKFNEALEILWSRLRECDEIITKEQPWKLESADDVKKVLEPVAQHILSVAELLQPFMPNISEKVVEQFSQRKIKKQNPLFPRLIINK